MAQKPQILHDFFLKCSTRTWKKKNVQSTYFFYLRVLISLGFFLKSELLQSDSCDSITSHSLSWSLLLWKAFCSDCHGRVLTMRNRTKATRKRLDGFLSLVWRSWRCYLRRGGCWFSSTHDQCYGYD